MGRLNGKIAVVTGSARGIGKQIALTFAREGADIVVDDIREKEMEATAQEIRELGRKAIAVRADVTKLADVKRLADTAIKTFKRIDILVNNAGIPGRSVPLETTEEDWDAIHDVCLKGVFLCTQTFAPQMIAQKYGKVISLASVRGLGSSAREVAYGAAKAGVIQLTKDWARELGPHNINVNAIAPGTIQTDMSKIGRTPEELRISREQKIAVTVLGRLGIPQDIANLALFLASDASSLITGQTIICDGGRTDRM